jgi:hypothetical protein
VRRYFPAVILMALWSIQAAETEWPRLVDGTIVFGTTGRVHPPIRIGLRCSDLWVSPLSIAFIAVDAQGPAWPDLLMEATSIYVAEEKNGFTPMPEGPSAIPVNGRIWRVKRYPRISPDLRTLYFLIPFTQTTSRVIAWSRNRHVWKSLGDATDYCVVFQGAYSGSLIVQRRSMPSSPSKGVLHPCYLVNASGPERKISNDCDSFDQFANAWARGRMGTCR